MKIRILMDILLNNASKLNVVISKLIKFIKLTNIKLILLFVCILVIVDIMLPSLHINAQNVVLIVLLAIVQQLFVLLVILLIFFKIMIVLRPVKINSEITLIGNVKVHALWDLQLMIKFKIFKLVSVNVDKYLRPIYILSIIIAMKLLQLLEHIA